jgi:HEAT repeat protein
VAGAGTEAASPLNRALAGIKSKNEDTRHSALEQLIAMKPNASRAQVVRALEGPLRGSDDRAKALAVKALVRWNGKASIPTLLKLLDTGDYRDAYPRSEAIEQLSQLKEPVAIEPIARRMTDVSNRWAAARALPAFGPAAERATLKVLSNKEDDTRIAAYQVLEKIGTKASVAPLEAATKDSNKRVSAAATKALKEVKKREMKRGENGGSRS